MYCVHQKKILTPSETLAEVIQTLGETPVNLRKAEDFRDLYEENDGKESVTFTTMTDLHALTLVWQMA